MYRLLIVDDEPEIREGLRLKIDAERLGLDWAGEASNGIEALEKLEEELIDIVVTDMNMPVMDGVSFLETCRERYPDVRVVVITGYEDFQYARAALRNQASDYLLKPVARDELNGVLAKLTAAMDAERKKREQEAKTRWELTQYYKEMKEHFILRLVKGDLDREQTVLDGAGRFGLEDWAERDVRFLTAGFRERDVRAAGADSESATAGAPELFRLPFERICRQRAAAAAPACEAFRDPNYPGLMHFVTWEDEEWLNRFAEDLREQSRAALGFEPTAGLSRSVSGFRQWKEGYLSSLLAWNLSESELAGDDRRAENALEPTDEEMSVASRHLAKGEQDAFDRTVRHLLQEALAVSPARFVKVIFQVYLLLEAAANELRLRLDSSEQLWLRPEMALALDNVDKAGAFLGGIARKIGRRRQAEADGGDLSLIENARQYIQDNYMSDLNLTQIAERFNYNASYFSELFKNKVGKTFIQYLTEVRMAQAVRLLETTQLGLWDISELTGFGSASYFSSKFKRMYGMSPSDYRQQAPGKGKA
ncbi:response regulator [Cohnella zeiphila]|uniref:Response regulator n=1 Tax=Cohnella zeiphila TaxID=2761120 RepID=A0A7X0VV38_9BACL|nr:response regulator [Cohnella zeiphila]MBB6729518.1 response regulator [Cohnella zeiphila]